MTPPVPAAGPPAPHPREQLLAAAVEYAASRGVADLSLRQLATELGTSHRMLIYHFGSKQGLLAAVVAEVERRQRAAVTQLALEPGSTPAEIARRMWQRLADPELWPLERLFFELYAQALQGREHTGDFLRGVIEPWLELLTRFHEANGVPPEVARAHARLGVAVTRGLLLDLLATGDRSGVDQAMELVIDWYDAVTGGPARRD